MRIHISLLNCRVEEKMPARPCPIRSVRSGPVHPVCPVQAPWAQGTGADRTDRTGQGRHRALAKSSLALSGPVRSGPLQCRTPGPDGPDRTGRDPRSPHLFSFEKRLSVAPKQAFGQKVMECCSKTSFCSKSDGVLLQNICLLQK